MRAIDGDGGRASLPFEILASESPTIDFLFVAPGHNAVKSIEVPATGERFERVEDSTRRIYWLIRSGSEPRESATVEVRFHGDSVVLLAPKAFRTQILSAQDARDAATTENDRLYRDLLRQRATWIQTRGKASVFFARYDAWTQPALWLWLNERGSELPSLARALFDPKSNSFTAADPRPRDVHDAIESAGITLKPVPLSRACMLARGMTQTVDPPATWRGEPMTKPALAEFWKSIDRLAQHHVSVLRATYGSSEPELVAMEKAILAFSIGGLRAQPELPQPEIINCEPEGAQFFVFAEFFAQAWEKETQPDRKELWRRLATLFAFAQPAFCKAYGGDGRSRRREAYRRDRFQKTALDVDEMYGRLADFRKVHPTPIAVVKTAAQQALDAFREEVDEQP